MGAFEIARRPRSANGSRSRASREHRSTASPAAPTSRTCRCRFSSRRWPVSRRSRGSASHAIARAPRRSLRCSPRCSSPRGCSRMRAGRGTSSARRVVTARTYAGLDWRERHLAAEDAPLFQFIEAVRAKLPAGARARVHERRRALLPRPRRVSPLSAQRLLRALSKRDPGEFPDAPRRLLRRLPAARRPVRSGARSACAGMAASPSRPSCC